jgi:chromosome condensin MukBEF MukE localization factor
MSETRTANRKPRTVFPEKMLEVMGDPWFPEITTRLEKGAHIGPEDGDLHRSLLAGFLSFQTFYDVWGAELCRAPENYFYLVPSDGHFGDRRLDAAQMLVGQALVHYKLDPSTIDSPVTATQIATHIEHRLGSTERYFREFALVRRGSVPEGERRLRAMETVMKALRRLALLGFCEISNDQDPEDITVRPRVAAFRFAQPSIDSGGTEEGVLREVRTLVEQAKVAAESGEITADDESEGEGG